MKLSTFLAATAAAGPAAATFGKGGFNFGNKFHGANPFTCPGNSDNKCEDQFSGGFLDWKDLVSGSFDFHAGLDFKGWTCEDDSDRGKVISGECSRDKAEAPSFGCGSKSKIDKFSVREFDVFPEFDCRLEFHYDMPDGSTCKHSSDCSSKGTKVRNTQCGGAKNVKVVFPDQPDLKKEKCKIKIPKIDFDCDDNTPPPPTENPPPEVITTTTPPAETTPVETLPIESTPVESVPVVPGESTVSSVLPTTSPVETPGLPPTTPGLPPTTPGSPDTPGVTTTPVPNVPDVPDVPETPITTTYDSTSTIYTTEITTITSCGPEVPDCPAGGSTVVTETIAISTTVCPVTETISNPQTTSTESPEEPDVPDVPETPITTTYDSTSTVYTTEVTTITSCGPEVPDCPAGGSTVVTQTVAVSTTVCPVTETITNPHTTATNSPEEPDVPEETLPVPPAPTESPEQPETPENPENPDEDEPEEPLPCPEVVPKCLNTWLHVVQECKNNLDVACFCPNKEFVEETYQCLYAYGETDDIVSEAVSFFQGICAPYVNENPGIVTDVDTITDHLTVTGTPIVTSVPYTTVVIETTVTEPCVTDGTTISESSTTKVISTEITVPEIQVPTQPAPAPTEDVPVPTAEVPLPTEEVPVPPAPSATQVTTRPPIGTISPPAPTTTGEVPVAGAARNGLGLGLVVIAIVAAL
ncbi:hypothetical protein N3K66_000125 [Trichothecium roseum]|uniref:Uncharacterized protein n=1 Tax=Trichothecium roseum TaxID=47278 RepID=A0ACC0VAX7_9HYPO|nr:hypothetical protein N3K66_000125 [Trichothecium roseum]